MSEQLVHQHTAAGQRDLELIDYLRVVSRRRWLILCGTTAVALVAFVTGIMSPKTYEASVTLLVTDSKIPRADGTEAVRVVSPETFEAIIKNQSIAADAIRRFELDRPPLGLTPARFLAEHISIKRFRGTNLIMLTATFANAKLAADVANFVAQRALESNVRLNQSETVSAKEYIQRQRDAAGATMSSQQAALTDFRRAANLETLHAQQKILLEAKTRLAHSHSDYTTKMRGLQTDVVELRRALAGQEQLLTLTKSVFGDPAVLAAAQQSGAGDLKALSSIQLKSQEVNQVYQDLQTKLITSEVTLSSAESQRQDVERSIRDNEKRLASIEQQIAEADSKLEELTRNYTLTKGTYELFTKRFDEASLSVVSRITELKIIDPALISDAPLGRHVLQRTVIAASVSLVTLILLAFFLEYVATAPTARDGQAAATKRTFHEP